MYNFAVDGMLLGDRSYLGENFYIVDLTSVYYSVDSRTRISHTQTSNRTQARWQGPSHGRFIVTFSV